MNKYSLHTLLVIGSSLLIPASAMAQTTTTPPVVLPQEPQVTVQAAPAEATPADIEKQTRADVLLATGQRLIVERLYALARLKVDVQFNKSINETQRAALFADIDAKSSELTAMSQNLKTGGYDVPTLKTKINGIYADYRIFAVFIPKIRLTMALDAQLNHATKIEEQFAANPTAVTDAARAKLTDAKTKIGAAMVAVGALKPSDYRDTSNKVIDETRATIKSVNDLFREIRTALGAKVTEINKAAKEARNAAIKAAIDARDSAFRAANIAYHTAMIEAQKLTDKKARKDAARAAQETFKKAQRTAQETFRDAVKGLQRGWKEYKKENKKEQKKDRDN